MLHALLVWGTLAALGFVALRDMQTQEISNSLILMLIALSSAVMVTRANPAVGADLAAAALLFALGCAYWLRGFIGAGDAKLFLPVGLLIGWGGMMAFALFLLPASGVGVLLVRWQRRRIDGDAPMEPRGIPYALPVFLAVAGTLATSALLP